MVYLATNPSCKQSGVSESGLRTGFTNCPKKEKK
jgi:hypothetical protein